MTMTQPTLLLPDTPGFGTVIGGGHRRSTSDPTIDTRAEELLTSAWANLLDRKILCLLDSEDPSDRAMGVHLAELLLSDIAAEMARQIEQEREKHLLFEAERMDKVWTIIQTNLAIKLALPLFVTICLLFEYVSDVKREEVMEVIEQFEHRDFIDQHSVDIWVRKATRLMPYLLRRQSIMLERLARKADRLAANPDTSPGVNWAKQDGIRVAESGYLKSRISAGVPQRGKVKPKPRDGMGRAKR